MDFSMPMTNKCKNVNVNPNIAFSDTRQGRCFAAVHQRMCEVNSSTGLYFTKAECCCTRGKGWGEECEECPHPGTGNLDSF